MKIIDMILSNIVLYEKNISAVDYINQTIETKEKWYQINVLSMESMLGPIVVCHYYICQKATFELKNKSTYQ